MIEIASQQSTRVIQLSFNLTPKKQSSNLLKPDERPLILGLYWMIVNNYKRIIIPNDSLYPEYCIVVV